MNINTTAPTSIEPSAAVMRDALDLIRWFSIHFPELPAPYVTLHTHQSGAVLGLQLPVASFDMWREALELDANDVSLMPVSGGTHLVMDATVRGSFGGRQLAVPVQLSGIGLPALTTTPSAVAA